MQDWKRISAHSFQRLCVLLAGLPPAETIRAAGIEHRHRLAYRSNNSAVCAPLAPCGRGAGGEWDFDRLWAGMDSGSTQSLTQPTIPRGSVTACTPTSGRCVASRQGRAGSTRIQLSGVRCCKAAALGKSAAATQPCRHSQTLLDSCAIVAMHIESAQMASRKMGIRTGPVLQRKMGEL